MHTQTFTHTVIASAAGVQRRFVTFGGAQAGAADRALGVALVDFKAGDVFAAHIIGVCAVESGGAVALESAVIPDAQGRAVANDGTAANVAGRALNAVTAAGQTLFILIK